MISVINPITLLSRGGKKIPHHLKGDNHSHCDFSWNLTPCTVHVKNILHVHMYMNEEYKKHVTSISTHKFIFMIKVMYKTSTKKLTILTLVTTQMN